MPHRRIVLFVEDRAHRDVLDVLVRRLCEEQQVEVEFVWSNATRGFGAVARDLKRYVSELKVTGTLPDLLIVASDGNCRGTSARRAELAVDDLGVPVVYAIPDPHIERWLMLDGRAFKSVFGVGCDAPDRKCDRDRYKQLLGEQVAASGTPAVFGGIEYAQELMESLDIERAATADRSFARFVGELRSVLRVLGN